MENYRQYKYALFGGSEWIRLYRTKEDYVELYSEETGKPDALSMDRFNKIVDFFNDNGLGFLTEFELIEALDNQPSIEGAGAGVGAVS